METLFWTFQSVGVTLKIKSRSQQSNQLFSSSLQCINARFVKIHLLVQKITHRNEPTQTLTIYTPNSTYPSSIWFEGHNDYKYTIPLFIVYVTLTFKTLF